MTDIDQADVLTAIRSAVAAAPTAESAMQQVVRLLKDAIPLLHVGRHLPDRRGRARARAVPRQAVAAHAHPARQRHLRRRRHREGDDHRGRRERGSAVSRVQHRDEVGDRRADHARRRRSSAKSTSTAIRPRGVRREPIARCSSRWRRCSPSRFDGRVNHGTHHHPHPRRRHRAGSHRRRSLRIFAAAGLQIEWDRHDAGVIAFKRHGQTLPAAAARLDRNATRSR